MNELKRWTKGAEERSRRAAETFSDRAARTQDADILYSSVDSPFGPLLVATTKRGLVRLAYPDSETDEVLEHLSGRLSPRVLESARGTDPVRRELGEYFEGRRRRFEVSLDLSLARGFTRSVLRATWRVPFGEVVTYGQIAARCGHPSASRATGNALGANPIPIVVPCHRVVRAGGSLGGYTGGLDRKVTLLRLEGVLDGSSS
jgi:methylated-DNA-[protein]-cysteine S-methyltransferase